MIALQGAAATLASHSSFSLSQSSASGNAIAYYTDDESSVASSNFMFSSRAASANSAAAARRQHDVAFDSHDHSMRKERAIGLQRDDCEDHANPIGTTKTPTVRSCNLLPIRSSVSPVRVSRSSSPSRALSRPTELHNGMPATGCNAVSRRLQRKKMFRKLAINASTLRDADMDKLLFDEGLGDGMVSARQSKDGVAKGREAAAMNLTIRLSTDYAGLRKLGCKEETLSMLHSIDPPKQEADIVAETVETGDMTLLRAPPEHRKHAAAARRLSTMAPHRRHQSPDELPTDGDLATASPGHAKPCLLRQQPARHASPGSAPPPHSDWAAEARSSPFNVCSMTSTLPRFEHEESFHLHWKAA